MNRFDCGISLMFAATQPSLRFAFALVYMVGCAGTLLGQDTTKVISGAITYGGQRDTYSLSVSSATRFYFDSLVNINNLQW